MRNTSERVAAVKARIKEIEDQKLNRRNSTIIISSVASCLALIIITAFTLPGAVANLPNNNAAYIGPAASLFANGGALGNILIGLLSFTLGVCVTILCYRIRQRNMADKERSDD